MQTVKALQDRVPGVDTELAEHMYDRQIVPQRRAAELRKQGMDVEVALVNTSADAKGGWKVKCYGCGQVATLGFDPGTDSALCPDCQRNL